MGGLFFDLFTSLIGVAYFQVGRRLRDARFVAAGVALVACPYFIHGFFLQLVIAGAIAATPFVLKRLT